MRRIHVQHDGAAGILGSMARSAPPAAPVARSWSARATPAGAEAYLAHFQGAVLPALRETGGHRGALVLRRPEGGLVRITVLTLWESMAAVERFAGADGEAAVGGAGARAVLAEFDSRVEHFELALHSEP